MATCIGLLVLLKCKYSFKLKEGGKFNGRCFLGEDNS